MAGYFRIRALVMGVITGITALLGIAVLHADAPLLYSGLTHHGLPLVVLSALFGALSLVLLVRGNHVTVRITAALAVVSVLLGLGSGAVPRYPERHRDGECRRGSPGDSRRPRRDPGDRDGAPDPVDAAAVLAPGDADRFVSGLIEPSPAD